MDLSLARVARVARVVVEEVRGYWSGPYSLNNPNVPLSAFFGAGTRTSSGITVNESVAMTYASFYSAVALIGGDVATLPLHLYQRVANGGRKRITNHPLARVLDVQANPEQSALAVREMLTVSALMTGSGYAEITRNRDGQATALYPIESSRVRPVRDGNGPLQYLISQPNGGDIVLPERNVFHLRNVSLDGVVGLSIVACARGSIGLGLAAESFGGAFFGNGLNFGGFLKHPGKLTAEGRQALRESLNARHQGVANSHQWLVLQDGVEAQQLGMSPEDSQFLEMRVFGVQETCRWFNIPPFKLGDLSRVTFSNAEQSNLDYHSSCLRRWLTRMEAEIQSKLIGDDTMFSEHKTDAILRGDIKTRYDSYKAGREAGFLSVNDCRRLENLDPVPDGDTLLIPMNHTTISSTAPTRDDNSAIFQTRAQAVVVSAAIREVMVQAFDRCCRREAAKARAYQAMPSKLRAWIETYYDSTQRAIWLELLRPSLKAWHAVAGREGVDVDTACGTIIDRHFEQSKAELLRIADLGEGFAFSEALQRKLTAWESDRAATAIDHLILHGVPAEPTSAMLTQSQPRVRTVSMARAVLKQVLSK